MMRDSLSRCFFIKYREQICSNKENSEWNYTKLACSCILMIVIVATLFHQVNKYHSG